MKFYKKLYTKSIEVTDENKKGDETLTVIIILKENVLNALNDMKKKQSPKGGWHCYTNVTRRRSHL